MERVARVNIDSRMLNSLARSFRSKPPLERRICNCAGLFFRNGEWTPYADEATVYSTISDALKARNKFGLQHIQLVARPAQFDFWLSFN